MLVSVYEAGLYRLSQTKELRAASGAKLLGIKDLFFLRSRDCCTWLTM